MDILISDNWLREFLKTKAEPKDIAKYLSLSGPSVEKVQKEGNDFVYSIEVTTNRVDSASVFGIAREASAILPRAGISASLSPLRPASKSRFVPSVSYLKAQVDSNLCPRFTAVVIRNVSIKPSPSWMIQRLSLVGVRAINNVVDISNYIMHELGQPVHTFDYDKINGAKMILRESKRGEKITTLDEKSHTLPGGDIIIEDGEGKLIDLAGIMGAYNSAVDNSTKNVLLFVQTYNPVNIRKTSMGLAQRTEAASIFEKGPDSELVSLAMARGIDLFEELTQGKADKEILDIYPKPYKVKNVKIGLDFINQRLGVALSKKEISKTLTPLGFETGWKGKSLEVLVPSFRAKDINIPEDIIEEVARIYGYHNLPSIIMEGSLPSQLTDSPFSFEINVKNILKGYGGVEVYTLSLVPREFTQGNALRLKNPLGKEGEYLRTSLMPSLISAAKENSGNKNPFHLFEMANIYIPQKGNLPQEKMMLGGVFVNESFRKAKGIIEATLEELNFEAKFIPEDANGFLASRRVKISKGSKTIGELGMVTQELFYYEFGVEELKSVSSDIGAFRPAPKYPPQIEDVTFSFPPRTKIGEVISFILSLDKLVSKVELGNVYKDNYTFEVWYQHPTKTLNNSEVEDIRKQIIAGIAKRFGAIAKS